VRRDRTEQAARPAHRGGRLWERCGHRWGCADRCCGRRRVGVAGSCGSGRLSA